MILALLACTVSPVEKAPVAAPAPSRRAKAVEPAPDPMATLRERYRPLPEVPPVSRELQRKQLELGRDLYRRLACASCHPLDTWGTDGRQRAAHGSEAVVDTPSVFLAALQQAQFHDGRAPTIEVASIPASNQGLEDLKRRYYEAFPFDEPYFTPENTGRAIASYLRRLVARDRYDTWLLTGEGLTPEEQAGFSTFREVGCGTCHFGSVLGGNRTPDKRIPGLRNTSHTGPWFADGSMSTLDGAIRASQGHHDLSLDDDQVRSIRTFLGALGARPALDAGIPSELIPPPAR